MIWDRALEKDPREDKLPRWAQKKLIGVRCCGGDPEEPVADMEDEFVIEDIRRVMPRVRRPVCPRCFQIPANSGACGCD